MAVECRLKYLADFQRVFEHKINIIKKTKMPAQRQSARRRQRVQPFQGGERQRPGQADPEGQRQARQARQARNEQIRLRDGVPLTYEGIRNRMIRDDQYSEGPASKKFLKELPTLIKIVSRGRNNALSQNYNSDFRATHAKFRLGDWIDDMGASSFTRYSSNK